LNCAAATKKYPGNINSDSEGKWEMSFCISAMKTDSLSAAAHVRTAQSIS
jgi:hypothetical protein